MIMKDQYPNDNFYELRYKCGNYETTVKFCSLIDAYELTNNLRDFLAGCAWHDDQISSILRLEEDEIEETEEEEDD